MHLISKKLRAAVNNATINHQQTLQYRNIDLSGNIHDAIALKELKMAHRNQTIITGGAIENYNIDDSDITFDFGNIDDNMGKRIEPMDLDPQRASSRSGTVRNNNNNSNGIIGASSNIIEIKDTEMLSIDMQRTNGIAVRPTTLNLSGSVLILIKNDSKKNRINKIITIIQSKACYPILLL